MRQNQLHSRVLNFMKIAINSILAAIIAATLSLACLYTLALYGGIESSQVRIHLLESIKDNTLNEAASFGLLGSRSKPLYRLDCLIFSMMVAPTSEPMLDVLRNRRAQLLSGTYNAQVPDYPDCQALLRAFPEVNTNADDRIVFEPYTRYILGMRILGELALSSMTLRALSQLLLIMNYGMLLAIASVALIRFHNAPSASTARLNQLGFLTITFCFALFYGLSHFGRMLYFAPLEMTHFLFILLAALVPLGHVRCAILYWLAAFYGSWVAIFEFLSAGLPVALSLIPLALVFGGSLGRDAYLKRLTIMWGTFCAAAVAIFAIKFSLIVMFDPDYTFAADLKAFLHRINGSIIAETSPKTIELLQSYGVSIETISQHLVLKIPYLVALYVYSSYMVGQGAYWLSIPVVAGSFGTLGYFLWRGRQGLLAFESPVLSAVALQMLVPVAWTALFFNHTMIHPFFMARLWVIPIMGAALLLANIVYHRTHISHALTSPA